MKICNCKTNIQWLLLLFAFLGLLCVSSGQCETGTDRQETTTAEGKNPKIHISSQRLISDHSGNVAEFIGNVRANQGETLITADSLKIFFSGKSEDGETSPEQSLDKLVATGNVEIKFDNRLAVARQAVYITAQRVLILNGPGAKITSGDNTITGEKITFYRTDGRFTVEGGVKAVILPDESGLE